MTIVDVKDQSKLIFDEENGTVIVLSQLKRYEAGLQISRPQIAGTGLAIASRDVPAIAGSVTWRDDSRSDDY